MKLLVTLTLSIVSCFAQVVLTNPGHEDAMMYSTIEGNLVMTGIIPPAIQISADTPPPCSAGNYGQLHMFEHGVLKICNGQWVDISLPSSPQPGTTRDFMQSYPPRCVDIPGAPGLPSGWYFLQPGSLTRAVPIYCDFSFPLAVNYPMSGHPSPIRGFAAVWWGCTASDSLQSNPHYSAPWVSYSIFQALADSADRIIWVNMDDTSKYIINDGSTSAERQRAPMQVASALTASFKFAESTTFIPHNIPCSIDTSTTLSPYRFPTSLLAFLGAYSHLFSFARSAAWHTDQPSFFNMLIDGPCGCSYNYEKWRVYMH